MSRRRKPMRRTGIARKKPLRRTPIKRNGAPRPKPKVKRSPEERAALLRETRAFKEEARRQRVCRVCGKGGPWEAHHVITRRYLRVNGFEEWHPDNSLRLCPPCHHKHTVAFRRVDVTSLTDRNIAYAVTLLGEAKALDYISRHYRGEDQRIARLAEYEDD